MRPAGSARASRCSNRECESLVALGQARDDGQASLSVELYLARHGETEWSLNGRHTGKTDLPLTPQGEEKAADLSGRLQKIQFDAVFSSPLQRARRTAELAGFPKPQLTALLREVDYGEYEGMTSKAIRESRPDWELYRDGSPGGETPAHIYARAIGFINLASGAGGRVLAFSHGHFLRAVAVAWMRLDVKAASTLDLDVATLSLLRNDDKGRLLAMWNSPP